MRLGPPPTVGGIVATVDPFTMVFTDWHGVSVSPDVINMVEEAICHCAGQRDTVRVGHDQSPVSCACVASSANGKIRYFCKRPARAAFR